MLRIQVRGSRSRWRPWLVAEAAARYRDREEAREEALRALAAGFDVRVLRGSETVFLGCVESDGRAVLFTQSHPDRVSAERLAELREVAS